MVLLQRFLLGLSLVVAVQLLVTDFSAVRSDARLGILVGAVIMLVAGTAMYSVGVILTARRRRKLQDKARIISRVDALSPRHRTGLS